jgi:hypothetical protein
MPCAPPVTTATLGLVIIRFPAGMEFFSIGRFFKGAAG